MDTDIRLGTPGDAARLADFAARTFRETFGAENRPEDMALHLAKSFGLPQQTAELQDPDVITLLADAGDVLAGFAQLRTGLPPPCVTDPAPIELRRFYVDAPWQGQGLARRLMDAVEEAARAHGAATIWLGVWERNARARAFYRKCGFSEVGSQGFLLGTDPQLDRVMVRALPVGD